MVQLPRSFSYGRATCRVTVVDLRLVSPTAPSVFGFDFCFLLCFFCVPFWLLKQCVLILTTWLLNWKFIDVVHRAMYAMRRTRGRGESKRERTDNVIRRWNWKCNCIRVKKDFQRQLSTALNTKQGTGPDERVHRRAGVYIKTTVNKEIISETLKGKGKCFQV